MSENGIEGGPGAGPAVNVDEIPKAAPRFSTARGSLIVFFFIFMRYFGYAFGEGCALYIYVTNYRMSILWYSIAKLLATFFTTYIQCAVAYYGDSIKSKYGRRKPVFVASFLLMALGVLLLSVPPSHASQVVVAYYICCYLIYNIGETVNNYVAKAWFIESTADSQDYLFLVTTPVNLGTILGGVTGLLMLSQYKGSPLATSLVFVIFGAISLLLMITFLPSVVTRSVEKMPPIIPSIRTCMRTNEYRAILNNKITISVASDIAKSMGQYFTLIGFPGVFDKNKSLAPLITVEVSVAVICGLMLALGCNFLLKRVEKLRVYLTLTNMVTALGIIGLLCMIPSLNAVEKNNFSNLHSWNFYLYLLVFILLFSIYVPLNLIDGLFTRDLIMFDTFTTGLNRENMYQTAIGIPADLISNIFASIPVCIFYASGFVSNPSDSVGDDRLSTLYTWNKVSVFEAAFFCTLLVSAVAFWSYLILRNYPLTTEVADQIDRVVKKRDQIKQQQQQQEQQKAGGGGKTASTANGDGEMQLDSISGKSDIAQDEDAMLFLHFTNLEVSNLAKSKEKRDEAKKSIHKNNLIGMFFFGPAALVSLLAGLSVQLKRLSTTYVNILIVLFLLTTVYIFYELLRYGPIAEINAMDDEKLRIKAGEADRKNQEYHESLAELLARSGIVDVDASETDVGNSATTTNDNPILRVSSSSSRKTSTAGDTTTIQSPDSTSARPSLFSGGRQGRASSIMAPLPKESEDEPLSGNRRIFLLLICFFIVGVLACTVL